MNVVLLFSLSETDVVTEPKKVEDLDARRVLYNKQVELKFTIMFWLKWLVAWLPKEKRTTFADVMDKIIPPTQALEDDDEEEEEDANKEGD